jgi:hypothetical protein
MTRLLVLVLGLGFGCAVAAQSRSLVDPTRPPNVAPESAGEAVEAPGPHLQSVLISPTRRSAVISGSAVALGGSYGNARVEEISELGVVLRYPDRREALKLLPAPHKRERRAAASQKEAPR